MWPPARMPIITSSSARRYPTTARSISSRTAPHRCAVWPGAPALSRPRSVRPWSVTKSLQSVDEPGQRPPRDAGRAGLGDRGACRVNPVPEALVARAGAQQPPGGGRIVAQADPVVLGKPRGQQVLQGSAQFRVVGGAGLRAGDQPRPPAPATGERGRGGLPNAQPVPLV